MPRKPVATPTSSTSNAANALREALADLLVMMPPDVAGRIAVACLRLAAAAVAIGEAGRASPRDAASELLLLLAEGAPQLPDQLAAA